jgi:hypothetical protein
MQKRAVPAGGGQAGHLAVRFPVDPATHDRSLRRFVQHIEVAIYRGPGFAARMDLRDNQSALAAQCQRPVPRRAGSAAAI